MFPALLLVPTEISVLILVIIALLLFGGSRLAGVGKGAGRAIREFKEETQGLNDKDKKDDAAAKAQDKAVESKPESTEN
ncbi:Sec-independent protein translocase protein TatAd [Cutibacterium granulosum]|jgi:twin arginine-targeting protein translocase, tatA/E family|uniref:Sec-independent protein translocase protein TatA n=3 Tax=Cutibacterium granulosum TaxID=33011 RepID=U1F1E7_9ACTN|nr:twin-arginine translocase TatA/TatE family subunit [Cutibacterium granulosum]MBX7472685.1 twin-arginine translocase TatA/TatE family subunit [Streptomyces sp. MAG02]MDU1779291.1 twin-arginine translocase TatA/TatE family subunit [Propionibacterium sp.]ERF57767.1 hypothetical protein H641_02473 [Cutibacterium granulosum DSM 20700]ERF63266.1 hypothetical protein H640_08429 [Cutibacterium granulosum TM11]KAG9059605.1 twin-arginine translocase TatA/TatE family subunit [Cutibacterium granulosum 